MAERNDIHGNPASTAHVTPTGEQVPAGKAEAPVEHLVARWLGIGCFVTLAVLAAAALGLGWVMASGLVGTR